MTDPHTQESRGFGFVKMETSADAEACIEALNQTVVEGKTMTVAHVSLGSDTRRAITEFRLVVVARVPPLRVGTTVSRSTLVDLDSAVEAATVAATAEVSVI